MSGSLDNDNGVASGFPSFRPSTLGSQPASNQRLWMAYNGWDCFDLYGCVSAQASRVALGRWDDGTTVLPYGMEGSGPLAVMAHDGSVSAVLSASAGFMASSQALLRPPPPPAAKVAYHGTPESYWVTGDRYAATADNVSLAQCEALCQSTSCLRFDYAPGWPRSTTCGGAGETLCHNCRVVGSGGSPTLHSSGQGYTAYCVADSTGKACASGDGPGVLTYGLMGSITQVDPGFSIEIMLSVGNGVNAAVRGWGGQLTSRYNKVNPEDKDFTTTHLGYDTDNGSAPLLILFYFYRFVLPLSTIFIFVLATVLCCRGADSVVDHCLQSVLLLQPRAQSDVRPDTARRARLRQARRHSVPSRPTRFVVVRPFPF